MWKNFIQNSLFKGSGHNTTLKSDKQKALIYRRKQVVARLKSSVARENFAIPVKKRPVFEI